VKEKLIGTLLMCAIVPMAIAGYLFIVIVGIFGNTTRVRQGVRALDHFVNATLFNGYAIESLSSHAWRKRETSWAKIIIKITDYLEKDHCKKANKREQSLVDLMLNKKLHHQTVGKKK
jgi:hypothetical protein